mgnify:CR=1 FL=1
MVRKAETINLPRIKGRAQQTLFSKDLEKKLPKRLEKFANMGDNKLVMSFPDRQEQDRNIYIFHI